jgi:hypothetical protein
VSVLAPEIVPGQGFRILDIIAILEYTYGDLSPKKKAFINLYDFRLLGEEGRIVYSTSSGATPTIRVFLNLVSFQRLTIESFMLRGISARAKNLTFLIFRFSMWPKTVNRNSHNMNLFAIARLVNLE